MPGASLPHAAARLTASATGAEAPAPLKPLLGRPAGAVHPRAGRPPRRARGGGPRRQLLRCAALPERRRGDQRLRPVGPGPGRRPRRRPGRSAGVAGRHRARRPLGPPPPHPGRARGRVRRQPADRALPHVRGVHRRAAAEPLAGQHRPDRRGHRRGRRRPRGRAGIRHRHVRARAGCRFRVGGGAAPLRRPRRLRLAHLVRAQRRGWSCSSP